MNPRAKQRNVRGFIPDRRGREQRLFIGTRPWIRLLWSEVVNVGANPKLKVGVAIGNVALSPAE